MKGCSGKLCFTSGMYVLVAFPFVKNEFKIFLNIIFFVVHKGLLYFLGFSGKQKSSLVTSCLLGIRLLRVRLERLTLGGARGVSDGSYNFRLVVCTC